MEERERYYRVQDVLGFVAARYEGEGYDPEEIRIRQATPLEYGVVVRLSDQDEGFGFRVLLDAPSDQGA